MDNLPPPRLDTTGRTPGNEPDLPSTRLSVKLYDVWIPVLDQIAAARGISRHGAMREAIWEYIQAHRGEIG